MSEINRAAYERLTAEDLVWLEQQPRTLERDHVIEIVRNSAEMYYGNCNRASEQVARLASDRDQLMRACEVATRTAAAHRETIDQMQACLDENAADCDRLATLEIENESLWRLINEQADELISVSELLREVAAAPRPLST